MLKQTKCQTARHSPSAMTRCRTSLARLCRQPFLNGLLLFCRQEATLDFGTSVVQAIRLHGPPARQRDDEELVGVFLTGPYVSPSLSLTTACRNGGGSVYESTLPVLSP